MKKTLILLLLLTATVCYGATQIQLRNDTAANWTAANPILAKGERGVETDTGKEKSGDGVTHWNSLGYFGGSGSGDMLKSTYDPTSINASPFARANHTGSQAATTITQDSTHRFATDTEKSTWNGKLDATGSQSSTIGIGADVAAALAVNSASNTSAASAATPSDSDFFGFLSGIWKKITWANVKATLKTYFDGIYENAANKSTSIATDGASDTKYPSAKAVKTYVDANAGSGQVFKVYTSGSWQAKTGYVWYRGTGDPDPTSSMGPYDLLNDATASVDVLPVSKTCTGTDKISGYDSTTGLYTCTADQTSGGGSGITSLNGATVGSQTFVDGTNIHVATNTGTGAHTIGITGTIPDANIASSTSWNAKLDASTAATTYKTQAAFNSYSTSMATKLAGKMNDTSGNPDGTRYVWAYNTSACPAAASTPVGALCTLPGGVYQNTGSAWVVPPNAGGGSSYTLPTASTSVLGGVKVDGSSITIDGSGVISAMAGSVTSTGLITAGLAGNQTVKRGFAYIASANYRATFGNYSTGLATFAAYGNYSGRIIPASGAKFAWNNPVTFTGYTTSAGYSVKVPPNSSVTLQSLGSGTYYATATRNLQKTGVNEYAGAGGGSCSSTPFLSSTDISQDAFSTAYHDPGMYYQGTGGQSLCQVDVYLTKTGTITGKSFVVKVYATDGSLHPNLGTLLGTSTAVSGSAITSGAFNTFTFSTPVTLPSNYAMTVTAGTPDYTNFVTMKDSASNGVTAWHTQQWDSGVYNNNADFDPAMKLYGTP